MFENVNSYDKIVETTFGVGSCDYVILDDFKSMIIYIIGKDVMEYQYHGVYFHFLTKLSQPCHVVYNLHQLVMAYTTCYWDIIGLFDLSYLYSYKY